MYCDYSPLTLPQHIRGHGLRSFAGYWLVIFTQELELSVSLQAIDSHILHSKAFVSEEDEVASSFFYHIVCLATSTDKLLQGVIHSALFGGVPGHILFR